MKNRIVVITARGGSGAVRDIICHVLKERGQWDEAIRQVYIVHLYN